MANLKNFEKHIAIALAAADEAAKAILSIYQNSDWSVEMKADNSPLTVADKTSHSIIEAALAQTGLPVLSEEGRNIPYEERKNWDLFWLVDPLDGTKEFIKRNGEFTVNIALMHNNIPVWGVVYAPVLDKCYFMDADGRGWLRYAGDRVLLGKKERTDLSSMGVRVVASRSHLDEQTNQFISSLNQPVLVNMGSSLKFMMLAEGKADVYPRFAPTMEWDTAAAHAILNALGFSISQNLSNNELIYNKADLLNPSFIAKSTVSYGE